jgi:UDP-glucose 4-epimerase
VILITGGMGFIGLHTARRFLDAGENVVLTRYRVAREPDFIKDEIGKRVFVETMDVTSTHDMIDVVRKHKVTGIVHLAVPGVGALSPAEDYRVNMAGLINVLEAAKAGDVQRLTFASSISVYSSIPQGPFHENMPLPLPSTNPTEAYKKAWEILALHWADRSGIEVIPVRASGIWGPLYHTLLNLPSRVAHAAASGKAASFAGARGGPPAADDQGDFCYVKDCALGFFLLQTHEGKLPHAIYNVGAGESRTNADVVAAAKRVVPDVQIELQPGKGGRSRPNPHEDITLAKEDVGYTPHYTLESGMAEYIEWLKKGNQY